MHLEYDYDDGPIAVPDTAVLAALMVHSDPDADVQTLSWTEAL